MADTTACEEGGFAHLAGGVRIPTLFLGTFRVRGREQIASCLDAALGSGYRGVDTAGVYRNESEIGAALFGDAGDGADGLLRRHGLSRADVFLTSKLPPNRHGYEAAKEACRQSVSKLRCGRLDLLLVHWPGVQGLRHSDPKQAQLRRDTWLAMEQLLAEGLVRSIGVSNYEPRHLEELRQFATAPCSVLQSECHPMLQRTDLRHLCRQRGIHFQAYSSLGGAAGSQELMSHPTVVSVAEDCGRSCADVLLRWAADQGVGVIPRSVRPDRISANAQAVLRSPPLPPQAHQRLSGLECGRHFCWDPSAIR